MTTYCELSAFQRDVLAAVATSDTPAASKAVKHRTAEIRDEPPTPYAYQVLDHLVADGWLTRQTDQSDKRVELYQLTEQATTALERHVALTEDIRASINRSNHDQPLRSDGGQPTAALQATLSLLVDDDTIAVDLDEPAAVRCRRDHGQLRIEAAAEGERTAEAVLESDPQTMTALADRLYAIAAQAAHGGPSDG